MNHISTVLSQMVSVIQRHEFEKLARKHHVGGEFREFNRWSQFLAMLMGQFSCRTSLRDIIYNLKARSKRLYHLGIRKTSRSHLARVNEQQPAELYEELFGKLLGRCQAVLPGHEFSFKNKLYLLDATHIEMCLSVFPWATFRQRKGGIKLHVGLDADGHIPAFVDMTTGNFHESKWAKTLSLPKGSFVCFDRGFTDYSWYKALTENGIFFVTRLKDNAVYELLAKKPGRKSATIKNDQAVLLKSMEKKFRLVTHEDPKTGNVYHYLTNAHHIKAAEVADIYKERWQIELFFKWIKQNLKIKTFLGTSVNAVMTQVWIALIAYLLIAYFKFKSKLPVSLKKIVQVLQLNLFERVDFKELIDPKEPQRIVSKQLYLW